MEQSYYHALYSLSAESGEDDADEQTYIQTDSSKEKRSFRDSHGGCATSTSSEVTKTDGELPFSILDEDDTADWRDYSYLCLA